VEQANPQLPRRLRTSVEETTAGDPMSPLRWTSKATGTIAEELTRSGHPISSVTVGRCLEAMGFTLQANVKTREGPQHPNRDAQFRCQQAKRRSGRSRLREALAGVSENKRIDQGAAPRCKWPPYLCCR